MDCWFWGTLGFYLPRLCGLVSRLLRDCTGIVGCLEKGEGSTLKKRGWVDIYIDILESASTPVNKTRLMYRSNLNFVRFNVYFDDFLRKGLLEKTIDDGGRMGYVVSGQGKVLLATLKNAEKLFSEAQGGRS